MAGRRCGGETGPAGWSGTAGGRVEVPWAENEGSSTFETVQTSAATSSLMNPSGEVFATPLFLLFAVLQGRKTASSEKSAKVTYTLHGKSPVSPETAPTCNALGAENRDRPCEIWISPDPSRQFHSPYAYSPNPINGTDPDGNLFIDKESGQVLHGPHLAEMDYNGVFLGYEGPQIMDFVGPADWVSTVPFQSNVGLGLEPVGFPSQGFLSGLIRSAPGQILANWLGVDVGPTSVGSKGISVLRANQDKRLSPGEIKILQKAGYDVHQIKGGKHTGRIDLFKDGNGNILVKPKNGSGPGDPTGININNL